MFKALEIFIFLILYTASIKSIPHGPPPPYNRGVQIMSPKEVGISEAQLDKILGQIQHMNPSTGKNPQVIAIGMDMNNQPDIKNFHTSEANIDKLVSDLTSKGFNQNNIQPVPHKAEMHKESQNILYNINKNIHNEIMKSIQEQDSSPTSSSQTQSADQQFKSADSLIESANQKLESADQKLKSAENSLQSADQNAKSENQILTQAPILQHPPPSQQPIFLIPAPTPHGHPIGQIPQIQQQVFYGPPTPPGPHFQNNFQNRPQFTQLPPQLIYRQPPGAPQGQIILQPAQQQHILNDVLQQGPVSFENNGNNGTHEVINHHHHQIQIIQSPPQQFIQNPQGGQPLIFPPQNFHYQPQPPQPLFIHPTQDPRNFQPQPQNVEQTIVQNNENINNNGVVVGTQTYSLPTQTISYENNNNENESKSEVYFPTTVKYEENYEKFENGENYGSQVTRPMVQIYENHVTMSPSRPVHPREYLNQRENNYENFKNYQSSFPVKSSLYFKNKDEFSPYKNKETQFNFFSSGADVPPSYQKNNNYKDEILFAVKKNPSSYSGTSSKIYDNNDNFYEKSKIYSELTGSRFSRPEISPYSKTETFSSSYPKSEISNSPYSSSENFGSSYSKSEKFSSPFSNSETFSYPKTEISSSSYSKPKISSSKYSQEILSSSYRDPEIITGTYYKKPLTYSQTKPSDSYEKINFNRNEGSKFDVAPSGPMERISSPEFAMINGRRNTEHLDDIEYDPPQNFYSNYKNSNEKTHYNKNKDGSFAQEQF